MRFKKILAAIDFSPPSRKALNVAAGLAADTGAELVLAHVWQPVVYAYGESAFTGPQMKDVIDEANRALADWRHEAEVVGAKRVSTAAQVGTPWHEIVELLRNDPKFDLVVLGTHGRTGIKHVLLGSVAEKVIRHAPCAALVVRE